ncbi:hypothetical protein OG455_34490 [Kitasatospora sp. NBC_01287]|uniref:hypothetical protein n=1 Tax=Kitasatospora sp. NBC_01287 TaxID=2903573 RepID=UPI00225721D3|nr:hypothetical protein [Kitasatospora sp. NBC_01287]MCX4750559.1 hypothetical protein [Kitasatospora sp. NBC_01287]
MTSMDVVLGTYKATRAGAEAEVRTAFQAGAGQLTRDDIAALARANSDLVTVLTGAEPADRAALYQQLGLILTYDSGKQEVLIEMNLDQHFFGTRRPMVGVRGVCRPIRTCHRCSGSYPCSSTGLRLVFDLGMDLGSGKARRAQWVSASLLMTS